MDFGHAILPQANFFFGGIYSLLNYAFAAEPCQLLPRTGHVESVQQV